MDSVDVAILRELSWKPFDPEHRARHVRRPWDIAKDLDVHGTTVKRRMDELRVDGVLNGVHLMPEPSLLGLQASMYTMDFPDPETKLQGLDRIVGRPEVQDTLAFVGTEAWVTILGPQDQPLVEVARAVAEEAGAVDLQLHHRRSWEVDLDALTELDLRILKELRGNAHRPLKDVAETVGVTPRTVRTRFQRLEEARAFAVAANVSPARIRGRIPVVLDIRFDDPPPSNAPQAVVEAFPDAIFRGLFDPRRAYPLLAVEDTAEVEERLTLARRLPGVEEARALLVRASAGCAEGGHEPVLDILEAVPTS